jgi:hypothetical protein
MPLTSATDISLVLSGGTVNLNPNNSLGGDPSSTPIIDNSLNNLFSDITSDQSDSGYEDYRCVYFFNDGQTPVYSVKLWIDTDAPDGSTMELGIEEHDEVQRITVSGGVVTGGSFTLSYKGKTFSSPYNTDLGVWATNVKSGVLGLTDDDNAPFFSSVSVTAQNAGSFTIIFDINFTDMDGKRNLDGFTVAENNLTSSGSVNITITTPQEGGPVNTIAPEINLETTPPGGVLFFAPDETSPIEIPVLKPSEGFPLWVKRTTPTGTEAKENDGFILAFRAESLAP